MNVSENVEVTSIDPLLIYADLPLRRTYYPLGFGLEVATNSPEVIAAAGESWGDQRRAFDAAPLEIRVVVQPGGGQAAEPAFRAQRHLLGIVSDQANFALCDCDAEFAFCFTNSVTAANRPWFRWHFLEAMVYLLLTQRRLVPVHAACVERNGRGVLLCGRSGAGKSTLAFACARAGWTYVADDATMLLQEGGERVAIGNPRFVRFRKDAPEIFPELAGCDGHVRPNGKFTIEAETAALPGIRAASRSRIEKLAFLDRGKGPAEARRIAASDAGERLLQELPTYQEKVRARHAGVVARLSQVPAYELSYEALPDAIEILQRILEQS